MYKLYQYPRIQKKASRSSEAEKQKIKEAIELHDDGIYEEAIKIYEELLATNPDNVLVLYEIAYSYFIHQIVQEEEIQGWLRKNWPEVHKFKNWNEEYQLTIITAN